MGVFSLWSCMGTEIEYMVVSKDGLDVRPIVPALLGKLGGEDCEDFCDGPVAWSNELVAHVVEFKMAEPALLPLRQWESHFHSQVERANRLLEPWGACLLPTGAHPWMDPAQETVLWAGESAGIYQLYDKLFGCKGHGWSNLQSAHLNLPFAGDEEFHRLHAAVRVLLPLLPALSASTPFLEGRRTPWLDTRLEAYRHNQERIPVITGHVVPEAVKSRREYEEKIFAPIREAIAVHDKEKILDHHFLNSRGAIARFDRDAIEIRVLDTQECPTADLAIQCLVIASLRVLAEERWVPLKELDAISEQDLLAILLDVVQDGQAAVVKHPALLRALGLPKASVRVREIWLHLVAVLGGLQGIWLPASMRPALETILQKGCLASRMLQWVDGRADRVVLRNLYGELARCLANNQMFS